MNNRVLTLSLVMAALAVFFVQSYVTSIEEEAKKKFGTEILVLMAKKDIQEMDTIDETMFELKLIPKRFQEPAAVFFEKKEQDKETAREVAKLSGLVALVPIKKGEQITSNKITEPNMRSGLSPQVSPGKRAVAVPVNEFSGVGKLVKPGDRVDVMAVMELGSRDNKLVKTVFQDVVVLAVGRYVSNNIPRLMETDINGKQRPRSLTQFDGFSSVTLEVEPAQAQAIALLLAQNANSISLSLRNNDDTERLNLSGMILNDVLGPDAARRPAANIPVAPRAPTVPNPNINPGAR